MLEIKNLVLEFRDKLEDLKLIGVEPYNSFISQALVLCELPEKNEIIKQSNIISEMGIGSLVLNANERGYTLKEISEFISESSGFNVSESEILNWIDDYEKSNTIVRREKLGLSVFNTKNRFENILLQLEELVDETKSISNEDFFYAKKSKAEIITGILREQRMLVNDAAKIITAMEKINKVQELSRILVEEAGKESLALQQRLLSRLTRQGLLNESLIGL